MAFSVFVGLSWLVGKTLISLKLLWSLSSLQSRLVSFVAGELAFVVNGGVGGMNIPLVAGGIEAGMMVGLSLDNAAGMMGS